MRLKWIPFVCLSVFGCSHYEDRPLCPSANLEAFESRRLDSPGLQEYINAVNPSSEWPLKTWDMTNLTLAAFFYHPSLDTARAQLEIAKGWRTAAGERPNPSFSLSPGFNSSNPSDSPVSDWIVDSALQIPVETAGKRGYRMAYAEHISDAARFYIADTAWQVRSRVRQALLEIYAANETESLTRRQHAILAGNVQLLQRQMEAGEISPFEVAQAQIPLNTAAMEIIDAQKRRAQAETRLAAAMGVPVIALDGIKFSFDSITDIPQAIPSSKIRRQALLSRPDVLASLAEYQASQSALQLEIARQYPDINIGPGYSYDQSENKWSVGISLVLPVFNQNQGAIAAAEGRRSEAAARFNELQANISSQIEQASAAYEASLKKLQIARSIAKDSQKKMDVLKKMYETGEIPKLEVTAAALELSTNDLNQLTAKMEVFEAVSQLEDVMRQPADLPAWQQVVKQDITF
jgi:cobalt-zinc-cadmium efflux system outer membrane protein